MKTFGFTSPCPLVERVPVPVAASCYLCDCPVEESDRGVIMPFVGAPGDPTELVAHQRCFLKAVGADA